jgi:hypothetical protein
MEEMVSHLKKNEDKRSDEEFKLSNFECFLYMSVYYKRKYQWKINFGREERKHI